MMTRKRMATDNKQDLNQLMADVKAFADANVIKAAKELHDLSVTSILSDGVVRKIERALVPLGVYDTLGLSISIFEAAIIEFVSKMSNDE